MRKSLTLYELNALVRETLALQMPDEYWVEAELSEAREVRGHCYMELIQKDDRSNTPVAKASAKCWASTWQLVKPHFMRVTGQQVHAGMKVLLKVYAQFHESYGFSWIVTDIDPTYTLGDMARKRLEIIRQLKEEGVFDLQKELRLPMFCQRIAVISSANAAGYGDFVNQLESNEYGFRFHTQLFPAIMQGEGVEQSVIAALEKIYRTPLQLPRGGEQEASPRGGLEGPPPYESHLIQKDLEFVRNVHQIIEKNLQNEDFNVNTLAEEMGLSRSPFFKKLKSLTGFAPVDLVKEIRLTKALNYVETTDMNFTEIAYAVGFRDPGYFTKCFRQKYGKTPKEYRNDFTSSSNP